MVTGSQRSGGSAARPLRSCRDHTRVTRSRDGGGTVRGRRKTAKPPVESGEVTSGVNQRKKNECRCHRGGYHGTFTGGGAAACGCRVRGLREGDYVQRDRCRYPVGAQRRSPVAPSRPDRW